MRKMLTMFTLMAVTLAFSLPALAQDDGCVIFSEYVEGSSNNKAVEIYNGTGADIDMSTLTIERFNNGSTTAGYSSALEGTLAAGDVFVIVNSSAVAELLALGDTTHNSFTFYNGDDVLVLYQDGLVIDSIGRLGEDPGSVWGTEPCTTGEHTLRRKADVCCGDTVLDDAYDPALEWDCFDQDDFSGVGSHTNDCTPVANEANSWSRVKSLY